MPDDTPTCCLPPLEPRERARVHARLRRYGRPSGGLSPLAERRYAARYHAYRIDLLGLWQQRHADRALAAAIRHRAARPVDVPAVDLLGGWFLVAATVMYPGALAIGPSGALLATNPTDRALSRAFTVAATLFTAYAVAVLAHVVNRPAEVLLWVYLGFAVAATLAWSASMYAHRRWRSATAERPAASHRAAGS